MTTLLNDGTARDEAYWAKPVDALRVADISPQALNLNVEGEPLMGPICGFGQLWQKVYRVRLSKSVTPQQVIANWKQNFSDYWPQGNKLFVPPAGIVPGTTAVINTRLPGNIPVMATGVHVIFADDVSFAYLTPAGHPLNGMITFSAFDDDGATTAQVQILLRPYDPLYELGFRLGLMHLAEDKFWHITLSKLAAHYGVKAHIEQQIKLIDPKVQWSEAKNIWQNAGIRTGLYVLTLPLRWMGQKVSGKNRR